MWVWWNKYFCATSYCFSWIIFWNGSSYTCSAIREAEELLRAPAPLWILGKERGKNLPWWCPLPREEVFWWEHSPSRFFALGFYFQLLISILRRNNKFTEKRRGPYCRGLYIFFVSVLKLLSMNYNILANLARIIMNLISRKFKKRSWGCHSLFLQVMQIIFTDNVASY